MKLSFQGIFGTDGIRGKAGFFPLTTPVALALGHAFVDVFLKKLPKPELVVGRDTRISSSVLQAAFMAGATASGGKVLDVGVFPTGGISLICQELGTLGAVISASHNPASDNGIKLFGPGGSKLAASSEQQIEARMAEIFANPKLQESLLGSQKPLEQAADIYERRLFAASGLQPGDLAGLHIAVDCAHGAAYGLTPALLRKLGATVRPIGTEPDGWNINAKCGSQHPQALAECVQHFGCDLGIALDGDADRVVFVDASGKICDGDQLLAILATHWSQAGILRGNAVVATIMSNFSLEQYLKTIGLNLARTNVGDKYVYEELLARKANLGGEQSGHLLFPDHAPSGDGLLTALMVLATLRHTKMKLSEAASVVQPAPQLLLNVPVKQKKPLEEMPRIQGALRHFEATLQDQCRIVLRYSGTENLLRVMVEGFEQELVHNTSHTLARIAAEELDL